MTFRVGQKVVCVNDAKFPGWPFKRRGVVTPVRGEVYTIRAIFELPGWPGEWRCLLSEIVNRPRDYADGYYEGGWGLDRFRPVIDISDLQSIVTEVMKGKPRKIKADQFDKARVQ
jgi:hypothetical protein